MHVTCWINQQWPEGAAPASNACSYGNCCKLCHCLVQSEKDGQLLGSVRPGSACDQAVDRRDSTCACKRNSTVWLQWGQGRGG
jgi:hypothetical protein